MHGSFLLQGAATHLVDAAAGELIGPFVAFVPGMPSYPVPFDGKREASASSSCQRSWLATGLPAAVRQPRRFHCGSHSVMPFCTYWLSV